MNNKEIIKYFYKLVVSENLLNELPQYISKNCVQKVGANEIFTLWLSKKHIPITRWRLYVNLRTVKPLFLNLL